MRRQSFERKRAYCESVGVDICVYLGQDTPSLGGAPSSLTNCDEVHLSGGNTFAFLRWVQARGVLPVLQSYAREGGAPIGVGAGAILMTPSISIACLRGDTPPSVPPDTEGMDLVSSYVLVALRTWIGRLLQLEGLPWLQASRVCMPGRIRTDRGQCQD